MLIIGANLDIRSSRTASAAAADIGSGATAAAGSTSVVAASFAGTVRRTIIYTNAGA